MTVQVATLFAGTIRAMPGDGRPTGIFKEPVQGIVHMEREGLTIDAQADRRVHGGPEKAVHHFPIENHRRLAAQFPELAANFVAGALGENISTMGWAEDNVCIGDIYELGSVHLQVSQPRNPCWKIDARHGQEGIARFIAEQGIAGWYYRVLRTGVAQTGDVLQLLGRNPDPVSLREWWNVLRDPRPGAAALERIAATPGLTQAYRDKVLQRLDWLRRNAPD